MIHRSRFKKIDVILILATTWILWTIIGPYSEQFVDNHLSYPKVTKRTSDATIRSEGRLDHDSCDTLLRSQYMKRLIPVHGERTKVEDPSEFEKARKYLAKLFNYKENGTFLEAGGHDGHFLSNTYYLEKALGWHGVMIEPNQRNFEKMCKSGRDIWASNACISDRLEGIPCEVREFQEHISSNEYISGGRSKLSTYNNGKDLDDEKNLKKFDLTCFPLHEFLEVAGLSKNLDLLSLDVQGAEAGILETMDWNKVDIKVIIVELEHDHTVKTVPPLLKSKGYMRFKWLALHDVVFVKRSFLHEIK